MKIWLVVSGVVFVLGIVAYWVVSMPLRGLIAINDKKPKKQQ